MKHTGSWICICLVFSTFYLTIPRISISYNLSKSKCSFNTSSSFDSHFAICVHNLSIYFPNYEECSSLRMHFCGFLPLERIIYWIWYLQQHLCDLGQSFTRNQIHQKCQNMTRRELQWSYISSYDFTSPSQWSLFFQHMLLYSFFFTPTILFLFPKKTIISPVTINSGTVHPSRLPVLEEKKICSEAAVPDWSTRTSLHTRTRFFLASCRSSSSIGRLGSKHYLQISSLILDVLSLNTDDFGECIDTSTLKHSLPRIHFDSSTLYYYYTSTLTHPHYQLDTIPLKASLLFRWISFAYFNQIVTSKPATTASGASFEK